jgi:signal transduction histidine kinase/DNA-binding response OmpR family regulator
VELINADGESVPTVVAVTRLGSDADTDPQAVFSVVVTKVTELKKMQYQVAQRALELEKANEALRMHDKAKDSFLSNVSHELRTPLSTIRGYVEMLNSGGLGSLQGPQQAALKVMSRNVERLVVLINEMLQFSRMEISGIELARDVFSPSKLINEAAASIRPDILAKDLSLHFTIPEDLPYAWGDRDKLAQVLGILLNNAVKFTDKGGLIQISVLQGDGFELIFSISDTGIGIEQAFQEQIFTKFFQVDHSMTRRYEGTGIGLSIAHSIVASHGGLIDLKSEMGKGSTFSVRLPQAFFDASFVPEQTEGFEGLHVLLVTESPTFDDLLANLLRDCGCTQERRANGYESVRAAEEMQPDIILINDGEADILASNVVELLKQDPETDSIPIIIIGDQDNADLSTPWQDVLFLERPFTASTLINTIRIGCLGAPPLSGSEESLQSPERSPKLLVVDSDPSLLEWVQTAMRLRQVPCICATNHEAALALLKNEEPTVIILDADMRMGMLESRIGSFLNLSHAVPIYLMTAIPQDLAPIEGVTGVLSKPFAIGEVAELMNAEEMNEAYLT